MFNQAIIHYPTDENALKQIGKDIAAFRCDAVAKYIETLKLNDRQIEALFAYLSEEVVIMQQSCV